MGRVLDDADLYGLLLVITDLDLESLGGDTFRTVLGVIRHAVFAREVEAVAGQHTDDLVLRRVVDLVLADELELAIAVLRIEAHLALRQGDAELVGLGVLELTVDLHLARRGDAATIMSGTLEDIDTLRLDARGAHELDLLGLLVPQGRRITQGVEVEFVEGLLRDDFDGIHGSGGKSHTACLVLIIRLNAIHVAGHELDLGLIEGHAAVVVHRHPSNDVQDVTLLGGDEIVAGFPGESAAEIGDLGVDLAGRSGVKFPVQGRLKDVIRSERREGRLAREGELQLAVHLDDRLDEITARDEAAAHDLASHDAVRLVGLAADELERLALEERQEHRLRDRVVTVGLLEDLELGLARDVTQDHGIRLDLRRGPSERDLIDAGLEVDRQRLTHHGVAAVVDRERRIGGEGSGSGGQQEQCGEFHGVGEILGVGRSFPILISVPPPSFRLRTIPYRPFRRWRR